jgi:hypothetical protein
LRYNRPMNIHLECPCSWWIFWCACG